MNFKKPLIFTCLFFLLPLAWADRLVLKEGKTIHGKITHEDDQVYEITVGSGMFLRIEKSKVAEVYRKKKKERSATVVTLEDVQKKQREKEEAEKKEKEAEAAAAEKKEEKKTAQREEPKAGEPVKTPKPVDPSAVQTSKDGVTTKATKDKGVVLYETLQTKSYPVDGKTFEDAYKDIFSISEGKGFKVGPRRVASEVKYESSWSGELAEKGKAAGWSEVIVRTTMTVVEPQWTEKKPSPVETQEWNKFFEQVQKNDQEQLEIILETLMDFAQKVRLVQEPDEAALNARTETLFEEALEQTEKRLNSFRRRHRIEK